MQYGFVILCIYRNRLIFDRKEESKLLPLGTKQSIVPFIKCADSQKNNGCSFPYSIYPGQDVILDWQRKSTGWIELSGEGTLNYELAGDEKIFDLYDYNANNKEFKGDCFPSFCADKSRGRIKLSKESTLLQKRSNAFRYLRFKNNSDSIASLESVLLKPSEFPAQPVGSFRCSDELINIGWQMGIDTVHLCTQPGDQSSVPVFAPFGNGYVQWDGCRRDREIWGGDLRSGALGWYYNFEDQTPIANSLYVIMNAQHHGCNEHGLFPGSGSTHQIYYEWAFWEVTCLWEYILHTADEKLLSFVAHVLPEFLSWCERKFSENSDGWLHSNISWMYSLNLEKQSSPSLQAAAAICLDAMKNLFSLLELGDELKRTKALHKKIVTRFHRSFWNSDLQAYSLTLDLNGGTVCSDLCANCWAILANIVEPSDRLTVLNSIKKLHWTEAGSVNISPIVNDSYTHNGNIWPYANAYEVSARFHSGDTESALELFKRYIGRIRSIGHSTIFEMIHIDGALPIQKDGDTLSFCHAWAAQGSWALQRYLLGVTPISPGWKEFSFAPLSSPLEWVQGLIVTPYGTIDVELESKDEKGVIKGKVLYPRTTKYVCRMEQFGGVEFIKK